MKRHHKSHNYKFTKKHHSKKGMLGLGLAVAALLLGLALVVISFLEGGQGSVYLGSGGVLSMLLAFLAFFLGISSLREEKSYKAFPALAALVGGLTLLGFIVVYVLGFLAG